MIKYQKTTNIQAHNISTTVTGVSSNFIAILSILVNLQMRRAEPMNESGEDKIIFSDFSSSIFLVYPYSLHV